MSADPSRKSGENSAGHAPRVLITAGPTHEAIDDVRYLANRSSGRLGVALAEDAAARGWEVTLLLGPVALTPPSAVRTVAFESTADLERLLAVHFPACDLLIMAAAVADYRPAVRQAGKLSRVGERLVLELEPTPDLLAACAARRRPEQFVLGFALEEADTLAKRAAEKLRRKRIDAIVANPLATMGSGEIAARVYTAAGEVFEPPSAAADGKTAASSLDKSAFALWLLDWLAARLRC